MLDLDLIALGLDAANGGIVASPALRRLGERPQDRAEDGARP